MWKWGHTRKSKKNKYFLTFLSDFKNNTAALPLKPVKAYNTRIFPRNSLESDANKIKIISSGRSHAIDGRFVGKSHARCSYHNVTKTCDFLDSGARKRRHLGYSHVALGFSFGEIFDTWWWFVLNFRHASCLSLVLYFRHQKRVLHEARVWNAHVWPSINCGAFEFRSPCVVREVLVRLSHMSFKSTVSRSTVPRVRPCRR